MRYEIVFAPEAVEDLAGFRAVDRAKILDAIEVHLRYDPEKVSKSRIKKLREMQQPQYRLRIDDFRVFYDVVYTIDLGSVNILTVKSKADAIHWLSHFGRKYT